MSNYTEYDVEQAASDFVVDYLNRGPEFIDVVENLAEGDNDWAEFLEDLDDADLDLFYQEVHDQATSILAELSAHHSLNGF